MCTCKKWWLWIILVVVIVLGAWWIIDALFPSYYAVYLNTGDLYFGKLTRVPSLQLHEVWYLQKDAQGKSLSLAEFSKVVWGPEGALKINSDQVIWMSKIADTSEVVTLMEKGGIQQASAQQVNNQQAVPEQIAPEAEVKASSTEPETKKK